MNKTLPEDNVDKARGERLKNLRKKRNLTQEELAQKIAVTKQSVSLYEKGQGIGIKTVRKLAEALGVSEGFILEGSITAQTKISAVKDLDIEWQTSNAENVKKWFDEAKNYKFLYEQLEKINRSQETIIKSLESQITELTKENEELKGKLEGKRGGNSGAMAG